MLKALLKGKHLEKDANKTDAYTSHLLPDDLEEKKQLFWDAKKNENSQVWNVIYEAWNSDEAQAKALLDAVGFKMPNGTIEKVSVGGTSFAVPIYWINDPINYRADYHAEILKTK